MKETEGTMYMYNIHVGVHITYHCINTVLAKVCYVSIIGVLMRYKIRLINMIFKKIQIGLKITENKKLKRNLDSLKNEKELLHQDLEHKTRESEDIQSKLDSSNNLQLAKSNQINQLEAENRNLHRDLEKAILELADNLAKEPILQEQIQVKLKRLPKTTFSIGD